MASSLSLYWNLRVAICKQKYFSPSLTNYLENNWCTRFQWIKDITLTIHHPTRHLCDKRTFWEFKAKPVTSESVCWVRLRFDSGLEMTRWMFLLFLYLLIKIYLSGGIWLKKKQTKDAYTFVFLSNLIWWECLPKPVDQSIKLYALTSYNFMLISWRGLYSHIKGIDL